jgi:cytochrome c-type biogenesis protein CcmH
MRKGASNRRESVMRHGRGSRRTGLLGLLAVASLALATALSPAPAHAAVPTHATPQARLTDVEAEVMCPICGTLLELSESPQGQRERAFIKRLIAAGKTKAEIKDALVAQYGPRVLALPRATGFDLTAYLVPAIALLVAAAALAVAIARWRRNARPPAAATPAASGPQGEDAERLEADIARYDL